jgi:hypothetical protein
MYSDGLPPRPDRERGEPRPPRAPTTDSESNEKKQPWNRRRVAAGPDAAGPPLEWDYGDSRTQWWVGGIVLALMFLLATLKWGGFDWVSVWWLWLVLPGLAWLTSSLVRGHKISAGADWLNSRGGIVRTYELTKVTVTSHAGGYGLELADAQGGSADADFGLIQVNRDLWDLVYNGILHSVAAGAETNNLAVKRLHLEHVISIRKRSCDG